MKSLVYCLLLTLLAATAVGQTTFAPMGAKWHILNTCTNQDQNVYIREVTKDSTILGKYCTYVPANGPECQSQTIGYFVHQDSSKIYVYNSVTNAFSLLFDFDAPVGATWRIDVEDWCFSNDSMTITVKYVYPTYQVYSLKGEDDPTAQVNVPNEIVYKWIGGERNILMFITPGGSPNCIQRLLCYESPETGIVHLYGNSCLPNGVETPDPPQQGFVLFPNPAPESLTADISRLGLAPGAQLSWAVFNSLGQAMPFELTEMEGQQFQVGVPTLGNGVYFLQMRVHGRMPVTERFVIMR